MDKILRILGIVAAAQLVLVLVIQLGGSSTLAVQKSDQPLLNFNTSDVDTLVIKNAEQQKIQLRKKEGQWQTTDGFRADQNKVTQLIEKLSGLKTALPVATSDTALKRFKVDNSKFERHIVLQKGDQTLAALYLGNGAGARQSYARKDKDTAVYAFNLASYDFPTEPDAWQDKTVLQVNKQEVTAVTLAGFTLERDNLAGKEDTLISWKAEQLAVGKMVNQKAVNEALLPLFSLRFEKVLGKQVKPKYGLDKPVLSLSLTLKNGKQDYQFGKIKDEDNYVLKISNRAEYFQIPAFTVKPLVEKINQDKWLMDIPQQDENEAYMETKPVAEGSK